MRCDTPARAHGAPTPPRVAGGKPLDTLVQAVPFVLLLAMLAFGYGEWFTPRP